MSLLLKGTGISRGIAIGDAYIISRGLLDVSEFIIPDEQVADEIKRFKAAVKSAVSQLRAIRKQIPGHTPSDIIAFIDTHLLMMEDSALAKAPIKIIREKKCNAEWALKLQRDSLVKIFNEMDDPYLQTRKDDIDHVVGRIQRILLNEPEHDSSGHEKLLKGYIIIADDLSPADTALMLHQGIAGFITEFGGPTSHTAIIARSLGIPAIVGLRNAREYIRDGEEVIIDGKDGIVIAGCDDYILQHYRKLQRNERRYQTKLGKFKGKPAISRDGRVISVFANIELPEDIAAVKRVGADGVGLYRTEYLFMNRDVPPDENEQYRVYTKAVRSLKGSPVTIRTLDLGADKQVDGGQQNRPVSINPALGLRAIRLCLHEPSLFMPQLKAILRASVHGSVRIMIPMLSSIYELQQVKRLLQEAKNELDQRRIKYAANVPVGGMIEVPAAAISAHAFAKELDFLSIGTNDLIQYTLAIDRIDDDVSYLYDPTHPAVLQLIHITIKAGNKANIPVAMCGEMASDHRYTRLLLGMGLREFSVHPASLLEIKKIISSSRIDELEKFASRVIRQTDRQKIQALLDSNGK